MMKTTRQKPVTPKASVGEFNEAELLASVAGFVETLKSGKAHTLRSATVNLPEPLPRRSGAEIRAVREKVGASQAVFAAWLNLPKRTLESWENNQRTPSGAALKLLDLVAIFPELFVGEAGRMRIWLDRIASGDDKGSVSAAKPSEPSSLDLSAATILAPQAVTPGSRVPAKRRKPVPSK